MPSQPESDPKGSGPKDSVPWDKKTPEQRAKCVTDHLAHEFASGNLRPASQAKARQNQPTKGEPAPEAAGNATDE